MKKWVWPGFIMMVLMTVVSLRGQEFGYPGGEAAPWYFVSADFDLGNDIGPGAWAAGREYEIVVGLEPRSPGIGRTLTYAGRAPEGVGISDGGDGPYRIFRLFEPLDVAREEEIYTLVFAVPRSTFPEQGFVLLDGNQSLDYQILDVRESNPPEKAAAGHPVTLTYKIAFPVSIAARARKMLLLLGGEGARGPLQKIRDVDLEVKYTMIRRAPYFISETLLLFNRDLGVVAVRNDEMVFYRELFDSYIYQDGHGKVVKGRLIEKPGFPDGFVHRAPDDLDWVGLLNTQQNFGFFSLRLESHNSSLDCAGEWLNKSGTYFYAPAEGKYVYWVRPLVYTWAEYPTRNRFSFVPAGSRFYEKSAYLVFRLEDGYTERLNELLLRLKHPVRIY
jgi:hypothetical protein